MLKEAREAAGLTQAQAAEALGVHELTVSRWERGDREPGGKNFDEALRLYRQTALDRSAYNGVPRGTSGILSEDRKPYGQNAGGLEARKKVALFVSEMIDAGADRAEVDFIEETFRRPETARLAMHDSDGKLLTPRQVDDQYDALIDGVRHIITRRIERRRKATKSK